MKGDLQYIDKILLSMYEFFGISSILNEDLFYFLNSNRNDCIRSFIEPNLFDIFYFHGNILDGLE